MINYRYVLNISRLYFREQEVCYGVLQDLPGSQRQDQQDDLFFPGPWKRWRAKVFTRIKRKKIDRQKWIRNIVVAIYVLAVTYMVSKWAIHFAYQERGYNAVGGEYLFIPMAAWVAYKLINLFFDVLENVTKVRKSCLLRTGRRGEIP